MGLLKMKVFVKDPSSGLTQALYVEDAALVADLKEQVAEQFDLCANEVDLQYGIQTLDNESFLQDCGILDEGVVSVHMSLDGGKRKRKKKVHTTPKRIPHKHKKRPKALLEYFCADHPDRFTCGKTGTMFYKLTADGKRLPTPKQVHKAKAVMAAKGPAKKAKKKK